MTKKGEAPFEQHPAFINGLSNFSCILQENIPVEKSFTVRVDKKDSSCTVDFYNFPPGSVIAFR